MELVTTERLIIRRMAPTDLHDFLAYQTRPENLQYVPRDADTEERALQFLTRQATAEIGNDGGYFARAITLAGTDRMIGEVGIGFSPRPPDQPDGHRQAELGWSLHPDYWGHGYATEAARTLLPWAFQDLNLHRVTAGCDVRNTASFRLMERLGMRREAHFLQNSFLRGTWRDSYVYALLRSDWLTTPGA